MWPALKTRPASGLRAPHSRYLPVPDAGPPDQHQPPRGLYAGEPTSCRRALGNFLRIWAHLGLLLGVVRVYRIEGRAFQLLVALAAVVLPVHYVLPLRWKQPCLLAVSLLAIGWIFGAGTLGVVLLAGAILIGLTYLPLVYGARVALIGAVALALAIGRAAATSLPLPETCWPIIGTLFMFRMVIYLYELGHAEERERPIDVLSYFYLLPNVCFLHFPVVDYRTFRRGYFAEEIHATQRRGLAMMSNGVMHLLLYRLIYHRLLVPAEQVHDPASLAGFLVCNYLLYLRVSGQFHIACGMLHLFGYRLPETHRRYLLATGFTDYWRRINIYWKDFMVRVVFNPIVLRLRRRPQPLALAVGTLAVFITTWLLHAYQSFWLRGRWGFSVPDALFWGILGALVLINVQNDARTPLRRGRHPGVNGGLRDWAVRVLKTAGTFATITLLWALWSSPSVGSFVAMLRRGLAG
jgi:alginate O-acetyltransferase complex protein AlgI